VARSSVGHHTPPVRVAGVQADQTGEQAGAEEEELVGYLEEVDCGSSYQEVLLCFPQSLQAKATLGYLSGQLLARSLLQGH